eukprot:3982202-Alexandrium_andersonii.AAC.1
MSPSPSTSPPGLGPGRSSPVRRMSRHDQVLERLRDSYVTPRGSTVGAPPDVRRADPELSRDLCPRLLGHHLHG